MNRTQKKKKREKSMQTVGCFLPRSNTTYLSDFRPANEDRRTPFLRVLVRDREDGVDYIWVTSDIQ